MILNTFQIDPQMLHISCTFTADNIFDKRNTDKQTLVIGQYKGKKQTCEHNLRSEGSSVVPMQGSWKMGAGLDSGCLMVWKALGN